MPDSSKRPNYKLLKDPYLLKGITEKVYRINGKYIDNAIVDLELVEPRFNIFSSFNEVDLKPVKFEINETTLNRLKKTVIILRNIDASLEISYILSIFKPFCRMIKYQKFNSCSKSRSAYFMPYSNNNCTSDIINLTSTIILLTFESHSDAALALRKLDQVKILDKKLVAEYFNHKIYEELSEVNPDTLTPVLPLPPEINTNISLMDKFESAKHPLKNGFHHLDTITNSKLANLTKTIQNDLCFNSSYENNIKQESLVKPKLSIMRINFLSLKLLLDEMSEALKRDLVKLLIDDQIISTIDEWLNEKEQPPEKTPAQLKQKTPEKIIEPVLSAFRPIQLDAVVNETKTQRMTFNFKSFHIKRKKKSLEHIEQPKKYSIIDVKKTEIEAKQDVTTKTAFYSSNVELKEIQDISIDTNMSSISDRVYFQVPIEEEDLFLPDVIIKQIDSEDTRYLQYVFENYPEISSKPLVRNLSYDINDFGIPPSVGDNFHQSGAARSEGYYYIHVENRPYRHIETQTTEKKVDLKVKKPSIKKSITSDGRETRLLQRQLLTYYAPDDYGDVLKFNQLKLRKKKLRFNASSIHNYGLFCLETIPAEEMIIEYVGELIRSNIAEVRERRTSGTASSYFFKVDEEFIVDATNYGNLARFINHSCQPNCYAKIISVEEEKKVVIYSKQDIEANEEITYDYKFPIEENKIKCNCGTSSCRGFLN